MAITITAATVAENRIQMAATLVALGTTATDGASDTYIQIGGVISIPPMSAKSSPITTETVSTAIKKTDKGSADPGTGTMECMYIPTDQGQINMIAASIDRGGVDYNFLEQLPNKASNQPGGYGTRAWAKANITGYSFPQGTVGNIVKIVFDISFNTIPTIITPGTTTT